MSSEDKTVELPPDVILENPLYLTHLKRDFVDGDATEKTYPVFDLREGEVHRTQYTKAGTERLDEDGKVISLTVDAVARFQKSQ